MGNFDTKKVNSSDEAYSYGGPDSPITITAHGINMILAAMGVPDRARRQPWLPMVAAKYLFYQMPRVDKAWCPYCIVDTLATWPPSASPYARPASPGRLARALAISRGAGLTQR